MDKRMISYLAKQSRLDAYILQNSKNKLEDNELFTNRVLAFNVEIGELANEVRTFKHWSKKGPSPKDVCLEEYVDALHFLLSITNQISDLELVRLNEFVSIKTNIFPNVDFKCEVHDATNFDINSSFIALYSASTELYFSFIERDVERLRDLLEDVWSIFTHLGGQLQFANADIDVSYDAKYKVNIQRQEEGY